MANRNRKHKITLYLSDDEMYILKNKILFYRMGGGVEEGERMEEK